MRALGRAVLVLVLVAFGAGCPSKPETEEQVRKRESDALLARTHSWKATIYCAAKTAVRALPPRDDVQALAKGKQTLTREEWVALLEKDPALAVHAKHPGFFYVGAQLREAALNAALVGGAVLAARGGGHLAGAAEVTSWQLPRTDSPFGGASAFYSECKELLSDDEDRYPTLVIGLLPGDVGRAAKAREGAFAKPPWDRIAVNATEHLVLGLAWIAVEPDLATYELARAKPEELTAIEDVVLRGARAAMWMRADWNYHALDELTALEKRIPEAAPIMARNDELRDVKATEGFLRALVHLGRNEAYTRLKRPDDAAKELALANEASQDAEHWKVLGHLIKARVHLDRHEFKATATEIRTAAKALEHDAKQYAEFQEIANRIEKELPDSLSPVDLVRFAARVVRDDLAKRVVGDESARFAERFRDRARESVDGLSKTFPSTEDVTSKARELFGRITGRAAPVATASTAVVDSTR